MLLRVLPQLVETPERHANGGDCDGEEDGDSWDDQNDGVDDAGVVDGADGDSFCKRQRQ